MFFYHLKDYLFTYIGKNLKYSNAATNIWIKVVRKSENICDCTTIKTKELATMNH